MKIGYTFILACFLIIFSSKAQVTSTGNWTAIGNTNLSIVTDDADNTDSVGDGAIFVDGQDTATTQGISHTFDGTMTLGESFTINTYTYNRNVSFVKFTVGLYNVTSGAQLAISSEVSISNESSTPVLTTLNYAAIASDVGDILEVRYYRTSDFNTARNFAIDNLKLNGSFVSISLASSCPFTLTPDLSLDTSNATIELEINTAVDRFSDEYLGLSAPSTGELTTAESSYAALNINVSGGEITGNTLSNFDDVSFLKTFAQQLKFNPGDTAIQEKANNTVWLTGTQFCSGVLARDNTMYKYDNFARSTTLLNDFLDTEVKALFGYTLYVHSDSFEHFWEPTYDDAYQEINGSINTDLIFNISDAMLAYSLWYDTADERYQYMRGYKRFINRFFSYTSGTSDGIKADGSGFHHWTAYNNYMYSFNTAASLLSYLSETSFQVDESNYKIFSGAFYAQYIQANDDRVQALSSAGRNPQNRSNPLSQSALKTLAIAGGDILGLSTADPIFAGLYNRIYGVDPEFNYTTVSSYEEGFFQFNHASAGLFRKDNWMAFNKGFSNNMWGSEIYTGQNRYGRYQSYGALEVIYPGDKETGNGYDVDTWDWNFNPGTTVINLPWENLHAERGRIDEMQQNRFVGTVNLNKKNSDLLSNNHGDYGLFAMDFQELEGQGFSTDHGGGEQHNDTFTFKKSNFYFDDIIVCLGSGITNDDATNSTITTLYQRLDNSGNGAYVNGTEYTSTGENSFSGASNNWLLSNYDTGFYLLSNTSTLKINKALQQTPNQNQIWPVDYSGNATDTYYTGYIDHGTNPSNESYEYVLKPSSSVSEMQALHTTIQGGNKPYTVHQQDANAHIVEHEAKNVWGYAFFNSATSLSYDYITDVNASCLVMTEYNATDQTLLVSLSNPDIGLNIRDYSPSLVVQKQITLQGEWYFASTNSDVSILSSSVTETVIEFTTVDGLSYEVLLKQGTEPCGTTTTFSSGTWDNGIPTNTSKTIITETYNTTSGDINSCSLEIRSNVDVTIANGDYIKVEGDIIVNGSLSVENEGSVVQVENDAIVKNNGTIEVIKTTSYSDPLDFSILGSPMTGATRGVEYVASTMVKYHDTSLFSPHPDVTALDPAAEHFADDNGDNWINHTGVITPGEGYLVRPSAAGGTFTTTYTTGTLNNGVITYTAIFGDDQSDSANVLSNPYASVIDIDNFLDENPNAGGAVYFWEHIMAVDPNYPGYSSANYDMGDISYYNSTGGVEAPNGGGVPSNLIPSGQGFGIKASAAGTITFNNAMRSTGPNTGYRNNETAIDRLYLKVSNDTYGLRGLTLIGFSELATNGFDQNYDSKRMATPVSLYSLNSGRELGIQGRSVFNEDHVIPLGFTTHVEENQEYTISINSIEGELLEQATVYLIDNLLNTRTNLLETEYSFTSNEGHQTDRFVLVFNTEPILSVKDLDRSISMFPNPTNSKLNINSLLGGIESVMIYDLQGRIVKQWTGETVSTLQLDLSELKSSIYLVKITTNQGHIIKRLLKW